jgi:hypothetical protein
MTTRDTGQEPRPGEQDDEYPDFLWPDDEHDDGESEEDGRTAPVPAAVRPDGHVPWQWPPLPVAVVPAAAGRRRRVLALAITAAVAVGAGAGAVLAYRSMQGGAGPAAALSPGTGQPPGTGPRPGQGGGPAGPGGGQRAELAVVATVSAVRSGTITLSAGPMGSVTASVTRATRFTGSVRMLAAVRVGDTVAAQIVIENGVAKVVTLQDPGSES